MNNDGSGSDWPKAVAFVAAMALIGFVVWVLWR